MSYASDIFSPGLSMADRVSNLRRAFAEWRSANRAYRTTFDELDRLTDRELADLGISRGEIRDIAFQASQAAR